MLPSAKRSPTPTNTWRISQSWGRTPDVIPRMQDWMFRGGPPVPHHEYYLRSTPTFEVQAGPHDWLMRHVFVGVGDRFADGNIFRYFAVL